MNLDLIAYVKLTIDRQAKRFVVHKCRLQHILVAANYVSSKKAALMKEYAFVTVWRLKNTSLAEAWKAIKAVEEWPQWWKGVIRVTTIKEGDADSIGKISEFTFKSVLPYQLVFQSELIQIQHHHIMIGKASGELEGTGTWTFREERDVVCIQYNWNVKTTSAWMNMLAPLLKRAFQWNHDVVMRWGLKGLSKKLHATVVADDEPAFSSSQS